jgi:3-dehydroquinate synthase
VVIQPELELLHSTVRTEHTCRVLYGALAKQSPLDADHLVFIADPNTIRYVDGIRSSLANGSRVNVVLLPAAGEKIKSRWGFDHVVGELDGTGFLRRASCLVAVGGGTVLDLVGFVAATYMRGVSLALVPTTLLAMVDAAIGGKAGINTAAGKHTLGAFHYPDLVYIDPAFLETVPARSYRAAFGELVKIALIYGSPAYFERLEASVSLLLDYDADALRQVILDAVRAKLQLVESDWREARLDRLLNLGHEVAHALEAAVDFDDSRLLHGEGVSLGVVTAALIAADRGLLPPQVVDRLVGLIRRVVELPPGLAHVADLDAHIAVVARIRNGNIRVVVPVEEIGQARILHDVTTAELQCHLGEALKLLTSCP